MNLDEYRAMKAEAEANPVEEVVENVQIEQTTVDPTPQGEHTEEQVQQPPSTDSEPSLDGATETPSATPSVYDVGGKQYSSVEVEEAVKTRTELLQERARIEQEKQQLQLQRQYYDAIQGNPEFAQKFAQTFNLPYLTPEQQRIKEMEDNYNQLLVKTELNELRANYGDIDEKAVIEYAVTKNLSSLDDAYKLLQAEKAQFNPRSPEVDVEALKSQIRQELERELQSQVDTSTVIDSRGSSKEVVSDTPTLTQEELKVARAMKMSPTEYAKWRAV